MNKEQKNIFYLFVTLLGVAGIGQLLGLFHLSEHYHDFVDERTFFGIHRFLDTFSNIGFLWIGILFVKEMLLQDEKDSNLIWVTIGTILVCFGSGYYHLMPEDSRLLWDRLPISIVFAGVLSYSLHVNNLVKDSWKKSFDIGYLVFSMFSVLVWYIGSLQNQNWLAPYVFIQFGGMILLIYIAFTGKNKDFNQKIFYVLAWYVLAKLCERFDDSIFQTTQQIVSGHTLKHIFSAIALYQWFPKERKEKCITRKTMKLGFWQLVHKG